MEAVTIRSQILSVIDRWEEIYSITLGNTKYKHGKFPILEKLRKLDLKTATAEDLKDITGYSMWACPQECDECGKYCNAVVEIGVEHTWESVPAIICKDCLEKALKLLTDNE